MYGNDLYHHFAVNYFNRLKSSSTLLFSSFAPHSMWYCLILLHRSLACGITISLSLALLSRACVYNREHQKTHKICTTEALLLRVAALLLLPLRFTPVPGKELVGKASSTCQPEVEFLVAHHHHFVSCFCVVLSQGKV